MESWIIKMNKDGLHIATWTVKSEEHEPAFATIVESIQGSTDVLVKDNMERRVISFSFTEEEKLGGRNEIEEDTNTSSAQNDMNSESTSAICSLCHFIEKDWNSADRESSSESRFNQGNIPYSGSISFRTESSATSTRSFAFPILQSQWNSSPFTISVGQLLCCRC